MPHIRMLTSVASAAWSYDVDQVYQVSAQEARELVGAELAELVGPDQPATPERRRDRNLETRRSA